MMRVVSSPVPSRSGQAGRRFSWDGATAQAVTHREAVYDRPAATQGESLAGSAGGACTLAPCLGQDAGESRRSDQGGAACEGSTFHL
jgi:hypothetical protein